MSAAAGRRPVVRERKTVPQGWRIGIEGWLGQPVGRVARAVRQQLQSVRPAIEQPRPRWPAHWLRTSGQAGQGTREFDDPRAALTQQQQRSLRRLLSRRVREGRMKSGGQASWQRLRCWVKQTPPAPRHRPERSQAGPAASQQGVAQKQRSKPQMRRRQRAGDGVAAASGSAAQRV